MKKYYALVKCRTDGFNRNKRPTDFDGWDDPKLISDYRIDFRPDEFVVMEFELEGELKDDEIYYAVYEINWGAASLPFHFSNDLEEMKAFCYNRKPCKVFENGCYIEICKMKLNSMNSNEVLE